MIEHTQISFKSKLGLACLLCLSVLLVVLHSRCSIGHVTDTSFRSAMIASIVKTYEAKSLSMIFDFSCQYLQRSRLGETTDENQTIFVPT